jgi:hypothetical protein
VVIDPLDDLVIVHQTDGSKVGWRQFGHIVWLLLKAVHAKQPGLDPAA